MDFKKILILLLTITALMGCSEKAKIELFNNTNYNETWYSIAEDEEVFIDSFQTAVLKYDVTSYLLFSDTKEVDLSYGGKFVVTRNKKISLAPGDKKEIEIICNIVFIKDKLP